MTPLIMDDEKDTLVLRSAHFMNHVELSLGNHGCISPHIRLEVAYGTVVLYRHVYQSVKPYIPAQTEIYKSQ